MKCPGCLSTNPEKAHFCRYCGIKLQLSEKADTATLTLLPPVEELSRGTIFAQRYEVIEELGKGGMGQVYRTLDTRINEEVALKIIRIILSA